MMSPMIFQTFHNCIKGEDMPLHVDEVPMTMQQAYVCQAMINFVVVVVLSSSSWSLEVSLVLWILVVDLSI